MAEAVAMVTSFLVSIKIATKVTDYRYLSCLIMIFNAFIFKIRSINSKFCQCHINSWGLLNGAWYRCTV